MTYHPLQDHRQYNNYLKLPPTDNAIYGTNQENSSIIQQLKSTILQLGSLRIIECLHHKKGVNKSRIDIVKTWPKCKLMDLIISSKVVNKVKHLWTIQTNKPNFVRVGNGYETNLGDNTIHQV